MTPVTLRPTSGLDRIRHRFRLALRRLGWYQAAAVPLATLPPEPRAAELVSIRPPVYCRRDLPESWSGAGS